MIYIYIYLFGVALKANSSNPRASDRCVRALGFEAAVFLRFWATKPLTTLNVLDWGRLRWRSFVRCRHLLLGRFLLPSSSFLLFFCTTAVSSSM